MYRGLCLVGTGKSTLVRFIIDSLHISEEDVVYCAYTGKATSVLSSKGNKNTSTLNKLLYTSKQVDEHKYLNKLRNRLVHKYKIIVIDEVSMAPKEMLKVCLNHNAHIICLGDPFQLPPITEDNGVLHRPHIFLTEIMRQEEDNEIIQASFKVRNYQPLFNSIGKDVAVISKKDLTMDMLLSADQVICATNEMREGLNNKIRQALGRGEEPEIGDKIICLKNYWETCNMNEDALINGTIGYIDNLKMVYDPIFKCNTMRTTITPDYSNDINSKFNYLNIDYTFFKTGEPCVTFQWMKSRRIPPACMPIPFTYAYAITCWKAQGSEWDKVIVIEEGFPYDKETHARFMYTAITRAKKKLIIVRK